MEDYENKNVLPLIEEYLNDKITEYAILIDGEWGCGKTYFYKQKIEQLIKNSKKTPIYVSLYGALTVKEVENDIHAKIIEAQFPDNKTIQIAKKAGKIICEVLSNCKETIESANEVKLPNVTSETIYNIMKIIDNYEGNVFVFDDLERCNVPICSILGYINDWVEHKKCKCIIIANQEEVTNNVLFNNVEGKFSVALEKLKCQQTKEESTNISTKSIVDEAKHIFNSNSEYNQIREKLIGLVIYYRPDFDEVFNNILANDRLDIETTAIVNNEKGMLISELVGSKHVNIRTLRAIIFNFDKVIKSISGDSYKDNPNYSIVMDRVLYAIAKFTIKYKKGNVIIDKNNISYEIFKEEYEDKFKFIDKLIRQGIIDKALLKEEIDAYFEYESSKNSDWSDPLNKLQNLYTMEDDELIDNIEELKTNLDKEKYSTHLYPKIISYLVRIKLMGFNEKYINEPIEIMKRYIKKRHIIENLNEYGLFLDTKEQKEEYSKIIDSIQEVIAENTPINEINNIIGQEEWGDKLYKYVIDNSGEFFHAQKFISIIDMDTFESVITHANSDDIFNFRCTMIDLYKNRIFRNVFQR